MTIRELYDTSSLFDFWPNHRYLFLSSKWKRGISDKGKFLSLGGFDFNKYKKHFNMVLNYVGEEGAKDEFDDEVKGHFTTVNNLCDNDLYELNDTLLRQREHLITTIIQEYGENEVVSTDQLVEIQNNYKKKLLNGKYDTDTLGIKIYGHKYFVPDLAVYSYILSTLYRKGVTKFGDFIDISSISLWNTNLSLIILEKLMKSDRGIAFLSNDSLLVNKTVKDKREVDLLFLDVHLDIKNVCYNLENDSLAIVHEIKNKEKLIKDFGYFVDRLTSIHDITTCFDDKVGKHFSKLGSFGRLLSYPGFYALSKAEEFLELFLTSSEVKSFSAITDEMLSKEKIHINVYLL